MWRAASAGVLVVASLLVSAARVEGRQPASVSTGGAVMIVTVRVTPVADRTPNFRIDGLRVLRGWLPRERRAASEPENTAARAGLSSVRVEDVDPQLVLRDGAGRELYRQPFTYPRVLTVPPVAPGESEDGLPAVVLIAEPEVALVVPYFAEVDRIEVLAGPAGVAVATRSVTPGDRTTAEGLSTSAAATAVSVPGTFGILIMSSGYLPAQMDGFTNRAAQVRDQLLATEPFLAQRASVRVSFHQNVDDLGCSVGCAGIGRLLCCNTTRIVTAAAASGLPYDEIIVVHNTPTYSGFGSRDGSSSYYKTNSAVTTCGVYDGDWTSSMAVHEFGHSFGNLCDEYDLEPSYSYVACVNCRSRCDELPGASACLVGCNVRSDYFRPEDSVMLSLSNRTFNRTSIDSTLSPDGLRKRLSFFTGVTRMVPGVPSGLTASASGSTLNLSWTAPAGGSPTSYIIEAGSASGLADLASFSTGTTATSFVANNVANGVYYVRVRATNGDGTSDPSNEVPVVVGPAAPAAPTGLAASVSGSDIVLRWTAPTMGGTPTAYVIEAGSGPGLANLANFSTGSIATTFGAGGVANGIYYVRVRATSSVGTSGPSNEVIMVAGGGGCTLPPGAPGGLTIIQNSGGSVAFKWSTAPGGPTTYVLEAGSAPGLANLANVDLGGTGTTFATSGVGAGTYYVRLRAANACGKGGASNEVVLVVR